MNDKIIFLLDTGFVEFGIAKYLKEVYKADYFAVMNSAKRKFVRNQTVVDFKETWFYDDEIENIKKPDLEYLSKFEKKNKINLWSIVYSERRFVEYNQFYTFDSDEILSIIEHGCKLFERILNEVKPDFAVITPTDSHINQLFHEMCKSKGIKILTLGRTRFAYRMMISEDTDKLDITRLKNSSLELNLSQINERVSKYSDETYQIGKSLRSSKVTLFKAFLKFLIFSKDKEYRNYSDNKGRTKLKMITLGLSFIFKRKIRQRFLDKNAQKEITKGEKYIYFPMHFQPERSTLIASPYYEDQFTVIKNIAKSLPVEYKLYVKENATMKFNKWRSISYYKELKKLPNVELIHPTVNNYELIKNSSLVIAITGTTGLEAALLNKASIIFGDVIYSSLNSVTKVNSFEELSEAIRNSLDKETDVVDLNNYVETVENESFKLDFTTMVIDMQNSFNFGGFLADVDIPQKVLEEFVNRHKEKFEIIASECVKKINFHKNKLQIE